MENKHPKFVRWAVLLGIVVVLNIFFLSASSFIFSEPKYESFCKTHNEALTTPESCVGAEGSWVAGSPKTSEGYCDLYSKCQPLYDAAQKDYALKAFVLLIVLAVLSFAAGMIPFGSSIVSSGLSYGGVVTFIIASAQYWSQAHEIVRLSISLLALIALLYLGIKRFKD